MNPSKAELLTRPIVGIENRTAQEVFDIMCDRFKALPDEPAPSPTNLAQWEELIEPLRAEIVAAGIDPLRLDAIVSGVPRLLRERDELLRKANDAPSPTKPEGLEWPTVCKECSGKNLTWFTSNTITSGVQQGRLNTSDVSCVFVLGCDECSETLAVVRADTIAEKMNAARSWLSPVSDTTDTVRVKREDAKLILTYAGYVHPGANTDKAAFDRLRASLNGGVL